MLKLGLLAAEKEAPQLLTRCVENPTALGNTDYPVKENHMATMTLSATVKSVLMDRRVTSEESRTLATKVLANGKVSKTEATQLRRLLQQASSFEPGAKERLSALLTPPVTPTQLSLPQAVAAAKVLGGQMSALRDSVLALHVDMSDPSTFTRVMTEKFGPGRDALPFSGAGTLTMTPIWPGVAPYPRIAIDPTSGNLFINDTSLSPKWFGPLAPSPGAKLLGTFTDDDARYDIGSAFVAGERGR